MEWKDALIWKLWTLKGSMKFLMTVRRTSSRLDFFSFSAWDCRWTDGTNLPPPENWHMSCAHYFCAWALKIVRVRLTCSCKLEVLDPYSSLCVQHREKCLHELWASMSNLPRHALCSKIFVCIMGLPFNTIQSWVTKFQEKRDRPELHMVQKRLELQNKFACHFSWDPDNTVRRMPVG